MSPKQEIYQEMLRHVLPGLRNGYAPRPWWISIRRSPWYYYDAELVHNLWVSLFEEDFIDHDIWFLNVQAKWYYENAKGTQNYRPLCELITELFSLVPTHFHNKLKWRPSPLPGTS